MHNKGTGSEPAAALGLCSATEAVVMFLIFFFRVVFEDGEPVTFAGENSQAICWVQFVENFRLCDECERLHRTDPGFRAD